MTVVQLLWLAVAGLVACTVLNAVIRQPLARRLDDLRRTGVSAPSKPFGWDSEGLRFAYGGFLAVRAPEVTRLMVMYWALVLLRSVFLVMLMAAVTLWFMGASQ